MIRAYREAEAHGHVAPASPTPPALPPDSAARQAFEAALVADEAGDPIAALPKYIEAAEAYRDLAASGTALSESSAKWQRKARACIDRAEELKPLKERAEAERRRAEAERELSRREEALKQREQQLDSLAALSLAVLVAIFRGAPVLALLQGSSLSAATPVAGKSVKTPSIPRFM
jgi:hypothetical protein